MPDDGHFLEGLCVLICKIMKIRILLISSYSGHSIQNLEKEIKKSKTKPGDMAALICLEAL